MENIFFEEVLTKSASIFFNKNQHIIIGFMICRKGIKQCANGKYWDATSG